MSLFNKKSALSSAPLSEICLDGTGAAAAEGYNRLRANITAALAAEAGGHIVGVTSAQGAEGKSLTSINLAAALARAGSKTLLLEGDMRTPALAAALNIQAGAGFAELLCGSAAAAEAASPVAACENLSVITGGSVPQNPAELLSSARAAELLQELRGQYDYIIIDLPAIADAADALVLAKHLSGMVIVARNGLTAQPKLADAMRQVQYTGVRILGFVFNGATKRRI